MSRIEKNAAGEDVNVNTPEYGCTTIEHKVAKPQSKNKKATLDLTDAAIDEGDD